MQPPEQRPEHPWQPLLQPPEQLPEHPPEQPDEQVPEHEHEEPPLLLPEQVPEHEHEESEDDVGLNGPLQPATDERPITAMADKAFDKNDRRLVISH